MKNQFAIMRFYKSIGGIKDAMNNEMSAKCLTHLFSLTAILSLLILSGTATAQSGGSSDTVETKIRELEAAQVKYLMDGEVAKMKENWASDFTVNNPFNVVQDAATGPIQTGVLTYSTFERNIEKVIHHDSVVIVMGNELVVPKTAPKGSSHQINKTINRRFMNVWMHKEGKWLMIARHANEICAE